MRVNFFGTTFNAEKTPGQIMRGGVNPKNILLGGGFKHFVFSPLFGEDSHFDYIIFFKGVETTN